MPSTPTSSSSRPAALPAASAPSIPPRSTVHYLVNLLSPLIPLALLLAPAPLFPFLVKHSLLQFALFTVTATIPCALTGVMWYVDFAWPWGLFLIGLFTWLQTQGGGEDFNYRRAIVCGCYALHGARMGLGAAFIILTGGWTTKKDLPRYEYQKIRFAHFHPGQTFGMGHQVFEIYQQCVANCGILAVPAFLLASNPSRSPLSLVELLGFGLWVGGWLFESVADGHKLSFAATNAKLPRESRTPYCNTGLWHYSRHPNYFGEWLAWCGLCVASVPSLLSLELGGSFPPSYAAVAALDPRLSELVGGLPAPPSTVIRAGLWLVMCLVPLCMYYCLSEWTGAEPAEYFSIQKRKGYKEYCARTNCLVPWFPEKEMKGGKKE